MNIKDLQLGATVIIDIQPGSRVHKYLTGAANQGPATIVGLDYNKQSVPSGNFFALLGWKDDETPLAFIPGTKLIHLPQCKYLDDINDWKHLLWVDTSDVVGVVSVSREKKKYPGGICPCGMAQDTCEYHR